MLRGLHAVSLIALSDLIFYVVYKAVHSTLGQLKCFRSGSLKFGMDISHEMLAVNLALECATKCVVGICYHVAKRK